MSTTLALVPAPASAAAEPPAGSVTVQLVTTNGSGCPPGSVTVDSTAERFRLRYSYYLASAGGNSSPSDLRTSCQVSVRVSHPPEFTYGIARVENKGFASLEEGASGTLRSSYSILGRNPLPGRPRVIHGLYVDDWQFVDQSDIPEVNVRPCGERGNTTLATELSVDLGTSNASKTSFMFLDSSDSGLGSTYQFYWLRHC
ncbi:DUF4360 domain-containing protein [Actinomadura sp. NEAU-AAG7]|uniref:DUF4360 domain-containing protein n=1 Tax=Actinomadura sp. NEAU-AAG7 TaxID=2839640 RepID=UPI001BE42052|nr:DUF4360 domain-containing protein [Actinomadura sp. NEAU-AAG7]